MKPLFPGQQPNEKICEITRPHWIVLAGQIAVWLIFVAIFLGYDSYLVQEFAVLRTPQAIKIAGVVKSLYLMYLLAGLFSIWILYYLSFQIITDSRIVDMDQRSLLFHAMTEINLAQIEDVTAEIKGLFGNLFNYGTVYVQTAGTTQKFEFENVPDPNRIAKLLLDLYERIPIAHRAAAREDK